VLTPTIMPHNSIYAYNFIMSNDFFRRLDKILRDSSLGRTNSVDQIEAIDSECWAGIAGDVIANHTQLVLNGKDGIVYAESPVWAHSVTQQRIRLLEAIRNKGLNVDSLEVRSQPSKLVGTNKRDGKKPSRIPQEAAYTLEQTAAEIENEQLRSALIRLSKFGKT